MVQPVAASRLRLGFMIPSTNFIVEPDIYAMLPRNVTAHFARLLITGKDITEIGYPGIWRECNSALPLAVDQLATAKPACIAYAVTAGTFFGGRKWEEDMRAGVTQRTGLPATSTSFAIVRALDTYHARRIAVATAYSDLLTNALGRFLREYDLDILALEGLGDTRVQQPASESNDRVVTLVKKLDSPSVEAVVVSCAGLSALDVIEPLERELGKPVIASNQAVFWSALRAAGSDQTVRGFGSLLEEH